MSFAHWTRTYSTKLVDGYWCQRPYTSLYHFYPVGPGKVAYWLVKCKCPLTGLHHFYCNMFPTPQCCMCQCPPTGWLHFYCLWIWLGRVYFQNVSMPLNRLTLFLHINRLCTWWSTMSCQCPLSGLYHFYPALLEAPVYKALKGAFSQGFWSCYKSVTFCLFFGFSEFW